MSIALSPSPTIGKHSKFGDYIEDIFGDVIVNFIAVRIGDLIGEINLYFWEILQYLYFNRW